MKILNLEEVDYLLSYLKYSQHKNLYIPTLIAVTCGLRRGEALGLQWANVDLENSIIYIKDNYIKIDKETVMSALKTKGSKRNIPLIDLVVSELNQWKLDQKLNKIEITKIRFRDLRHYVECFVMGSA